MRLRRVNVSPELIAEVFTQGYSFAGTVTEGLPAGAVLIGIGYDTSRSSWAFDFVHESFPDLLDGMVVESRPVIVTRKDF